jgi:hypothetical protein
MQLLISAPAKRSEILVSAPQSETASTQRPKLKMVWHKEWDGKRERMAAQWVIDQ